MVVPVFRCVDHCCMGLHLPQVVQMMDVTISCCWVVDVFVMADLLKLSVESLSEADVDCV